MNFICKRCRTELNYQNINTKYINIRYHHLRGVCKDCGKIIENNLKEKFFVKEYENHKIYCKDKEYISYWGCGYYFKSLNDCEKYISMRIRECKKEFKRFKSTHKELI